MRRTVLAVAALLGLGAAGEAAAQATPDQLKTIRDRGMFRCGVYESVPGLSALDAQGKSAEAEAVKREFTNAWARADIKPTTAYR